MAVAVAVAVAVRRRGGRDLRAAGACTGGVLPIVAMAGAVALLGGAVRREPANAEAWLGLSRAARATDPELARRAAQRLRALVPPVPPP